MSSPCSGIGMWCLCKISQAWSLCLEPVQRWPQWDSAREQLAGLQMQNVEWLPATKGHTADGNTRGWLCHSPDRRTMAWNEGNEQPEDQTGWLTLSKAKAGRVKTANSLTKREWYKNSLLHWRLQNQVSFFHGFSWAELVLFSHLTNSFSSNWESAERTAAMCTTPEDPSTPSAASNSLYPVQAVWPAHCLAPLHAGMQCNPTSLLLLA